MADNSSSPSGRGEGFWQEMSGLRTESASHKRNEDAGKAPEEQEVTRGASCHARDASSA